MPDGKAVDTTRLGASPHTLKCPPVKINLSIIQLDSSYDIIVMVYGLVTDCFINTRIADSVNYYLSTAIQKLLASNR